MHKGIQSVDFTKLISDLHSQRDDIDQAIVSLERSGVSRPRRKTTPRPYEMAPELRSLREKIAQAIRSLEPLRLEARQEISAEMGVARELNFRLIATSFQAGIWGNSENSGKDRRYHSVPIDIGDAGRTRTRRTAQPDRPRRALGSGAS